MKHSQELTVGSLTTQLSRLPHRAMSPNNRIITQLVHQVVTKSLEHERLSYCNAECRGAECSVWQGFGVYSAILRGVL